AGNRRGGLGCAATAGARLVMGVVCRRLAAGAADQLDDRSFRPFRHPAGLAVSARSQVRFAGVSRSRTLQMGAPSALCRLGTGLLGHADDDAWASALCRFDDRSHGAGLENRRAGLGAPLWAFV